jgi:hypothetical protein
MSMPERGWAPTLEGAARRALLPGFGAVFVTGVAAVQWQLWRGGLGNPITYGSDASLYHSLANTIADHGWFYTNPRLGAPFQQVLYDYPLNTDNLHFATIRVLSWVSQNPFVITNLFALLTFPAVFAAAWFSFRRLRFSRVTSCAAAVVYTLAPYHFARGDVHLFLAAYYAVPLACLLLYEFVEGSGTAASGSEAQRNTAGQRLRRLLVSRWFWIPVLLGSSGVYYAIFFSYLALTIGLAVAVLHRDPRRLVLPVFCVALTLVVLLANNLPTFIYQYQHGPNHEAVNRRLGENDTLGLQFAYLVLPVDHHRLPPLAEFKAKLSESVSPVRDAEKQGLGLLAATGLLVSLGSLLVAAIGSGRGDHWRRLRRDSGALNVLALLLATVGGLSTIVGLLGFLELRAYARMSIFIAFFSLVALASLFESWRLRHTGDRWGRASLAGLLVVCLFAAFEQTSVRPVHRRETAATVASDREFVHEIERRLGGNGRVFVLPFLDFPETSVTTSTGLYTSNELGKPALFSDSLRWSWGAMKGRPENLTPSLANRPLESLLPDVATLGFDGIYVDRTLFVDDGREIEPRLESLVGTQPLVSEDGTKSFFDLRPFDRRLGPLPPVAREAALHPLRLDWDDGFQIVDGAGQFYPQLDGATSGRWARRDATLEIRNNLPKTRRLSLHADAHLDETTGRLEVRTRQERQVFPLTGQPAPITIELDIPPGTTKLSFHTHAATRGPTPGTGRLRGDFRLNDIWWEAPIVS